MILLHRRVADCLLYPLSRHKAHDSPVGVFQFLIYTQQVFLSPPQFAKRRQQFVILALDFVIWIMRPLPFQLFGNLRKAMSVIIGAVLGRVCRISTTVPLPGTDSILN